MKKIDLLVEFELFSLKTRKLCISLFACTTKPHLKCCKKQVGCN